MSDSIAPVSLFEARCRLLEQAKRIKRLVVPFFPNTYMLRYALQSLSDIEVLDAQWNSLSLADFIGRSTQLSVTFATREMWGQLPSKYLENVARAPITSFEPRYLYATNHIHFEGGLGSVDAAEIGQLADAFDRVILFGDTEKQTQALAKMIRPWVGEYAGKTKLHVVTPSSHWRDEVEDRHDLIRLDLYYMSPLRRPALDRAGDEFLRLQIDGSRFDDEIRSKFDTYIVVAGGDDARTREGVAAAVATYYKHMLAIASKASRGDTTSLSDFEAPWILYCDMTQPYTPTAAPSSARNFARLLTEHHGAPPSRDA